MSKSMYNISWYIRNMVEVDIYIKLPLLYYGGINSITVIARIIFSIIVLIMTMIITMFTMLATVFFLNRYSQEDGTVSSYLQNSEKWPFHIWGLPVGSMCGIFTPKWSRSWKRMSHIGRFWDMICIDPAIFLENDKWHFYMFLSLKDYPLVI